MRTDRELIAECLAGSAASWTTLIARYQGFIYSVALRAGFPPSDADDIFQNVCLKLCLHLQSVRDPDRLIDWLGTVTRQECARLRRRRSELGLDALPDQPDDSAMEEAVVAEARLHWLRQELAALPDECRSLLTLLYGPDPLPYAEVAAQLGIPIGSIGPKRARCLERLRKKGEQIGW